MAKKRKNKKNAPAKTSQSTQSHISRDNSVNLAQNFPKQENQTGQNKKESISTNALPKETVIESSSSAQQKTEDGRNKISVSVSVFLAGMFLSLVLGIYIGTLMPEMVTKHTASHPQANLPQPKDNPSNLKAESSPEQKNTNKNLPAGMAKREREILAELAKNPSQEKLWIELGDIYFDANLPDQSIEAYSHAIVLNPANPDVLTDMGVMYREIGNFNKALECFRNAYAINPNHTQSRYNEGLVLAHDLHRTAEAKNAWKELVKISPDAISPHGQTVKQMIEELK